MADKALRIATELHSIKPTNSQTIKGASAPFTMGQSTSEGVGF